MDSSANNKSTSNNEKSNGDMSFLASLIKRLESATSKIETFVLKKPAAQNIQNQPEAALNNGISASEDLHDRDTQVKELSYTLDEFINLSSKIHISLKTQAIAFKEGVFETLETISPNKEKVSAYITNIQSACDKHFNPLLRVVSELSLVLGWPWAGSEIINLFKGIKESGEFYRNKAYLYVKNTELPGIDCEMVNIWSNALFQSIEALKRTALDLSNSTQNRTNQLNGEETFSSVKTNTISSSFCQPIKELPPIIELKGESKWIVENYKEMDISIPGPMAANHSVYLFKCSNSMLKLENTKFTTASIDQCDQLGLVVERVISGIDIIRSKGIQIQVVGFCPTISIDSSEDIQIYLSKECVEGGTQVITSKTSTVNVLVQSNVSESGTDFEWIEKPIPEQFISVVDSKNNFISTNPVSYV